MMYFKGVLIGFSTVFVGCLIALIALIVWASWNSHGETTVSFTPMGFINHFGLTRPWFSLLIIALFSSGFLITVYLQKR
jgi:hypothetical protein